mgnify:CR=1 FL=1
MLHLDNNELHKIRRTRIALKRPTKQHNLENTNRGSISPDTKIF